MWLRYFCCKQTAKTNAHFVKYIAIQKTLVLSILVSDYDIKFHTGWNFQHKTSTMNKNP